MGIIRNTRTFLSAPSPNLYRWSGQIRRPAQKRLDSPNPIFEGFAVSSEGRLCHVRPPAPQTKGLGVQIPAARPKSTFIWPGPLKRRGPSGELPTVYGASQLGRVYILKADFNEVLIRIDPDGTKTTLIGNLTPGRRAYGSFANMRHIAAASSICGRARCIKRQVHQKASASSSSVSALLNEISASTTTGGKTLCCWPFPVCLAGPFVLKLRSSTNGGRTSVSPV